MKFWLLLLIPLSCSAVTVRYAADLKQTTLDAAITVSSNDDIIVLPAGSQQWTNYTINLTKALKIIGQGMGVTTIQAARTVGNPLLTITPAASKFTRISGITFTNYSEPLFATGPMISILGDHTTTTNGSFFRNDNCEYLNINQDIFWTRNILGLFDHTRYISPTVHHFSFTMHDMWNGGDWGHMSYSEPVNYNGTNFVFYENNNWSFLGFYYAVLDNRYGSRSVVRYNQLTNSWDEMHGPEEGQFRATRATLIYNNDFWSNNVTGGNIGLAVNCRSGTFLLASNTLHGSFATARIGAIRANRMNWNNYELFYGADGTNNFDLNFAGGPFETGTHTGTNGATILVDTNKSWSVNQWFKYSVRNYTKVQSNQFSVVLSSTTNTMTPEASVFGGFVGNLKFDTGDQYKVWKVNLALDSPGQGLCDVITNNPAQPWVWPNQQFDTIYCWSNNVNGVLGTLAVVTAHPIYENASSNFCQQIPKPGWVPSTYPHPVAISSVVISPVLVNLSPGGVQTFTGSGGSGNYVLFEVATNNSTGSITPTTGIYTAGIISGVTDVVRMWDSFGNHADATVNIGSQPPSVTFTASPTNIVYGANSTLTWTTSGATSVTLDGGSVATSGSTNVFPTAISTIYTLIATGPFGSTTNTVTVYVKPAVSFVATPSIITYGNSSTLVWHATNATTLTLDGVPVAPNGTNTVSPGSTTTYILFAQNIAGSTNANQTVTVVGVPAGNPIMLARRLLLP